VGQGALGIEVRADDTELRAPLAALHHPETAACTTAERTLLEAVGGGCQVPLGALATVEGNALRLRACACSPDGTQVVRAERFGTLDAPEELGKAVAQALIGAGASVFIRQVALDALKPRQPLQGLTIVVTRAENQASALAELLSGLGAATIDFPTITIEP